MMTAYTLHAVNTHYVTYRVHAETVDQAVAMFNDQDLANFDFDTVEGDITLVGATLDDGTDVFGAVTRVTGCAYCKSWDQCPSDESICPECCVKQAKEQGLTAGCCG
jgi:hypothetical protein